MSALSCGVVIAIAQILSILISITSIISAFLFKQGLSCPASQNFLCYLLLFLFHKCCSRHVQCLRNLDYCNEYDTRNESAADEGVYEHAGNENSSSSKFNKFNKWKFMLLALLDVEANFLIVLSFRYTSVTSVVLLNQFSIPMAAILTWFAGLAKYSFGNMAGIACCLLGLVVLTSSDIFLRGNSDVDRSRGSNPLMGDSLALLAAMIYASANVFQELLLERASATDVLGNLGMYGAIISLVQGLLLELKILAAATWSLSIIGVFFAYSCVLFLFYSLVPKVLQRGGSTLLNLSLLSSNLWVVLSRLFLFGGLSLWDAIVFAVSFGLVSSGVALYSLCGRVKTEQHEIEYRRTPVQEIVI
eukprot:jgi/Picsp_1/6031/NSC_03385-R1_solute carrier family 35 member f1